MQKTQTMQDNKPEAHTKQTLQENNVLQKNNKNTQNSSNETEQQQNKQIMKRGCV